MEKINRFPDEKVTGDELLGIIPPEVEELIEEYNDTRSDEKQKIDIEPYFTDKDVFTFKHRQTESF